MLNSCGKTQALLRKKNGMGGITVDSITVYCRHGAAVIRSGIGRGTDTLISGHTEAAQEWTREVCHTQATLLLGGKRFHSGDQSFGAGTTN